MSKYTTEIRFICEHFAGLDKSEGFDSVEDIISVARTKIFDFSYPIFNEAYRPILETKILRHFYTREIGYETYGLWKLHLDAKLNEIMPYYNKLYESELLEFDPLSNVNKTIDHKGNGNRTDNGSGSSNSEDKINRWDLYSDTPQGGISGIEAAYDGVDDNAYLTNARNIRDNGSKRSTNTTNTNRADFNNNWIEKVTGKDGTESYSELLIKYRNALLNIDMQIIGELNELFFMLW